MPNHELGQIVDSQIREILYDHGSHLDIAEMVIELRKERLGRGIQARVDTEKKRREWLVGVILPVSVDNTLHAVLLSNNRIFYVGSQSDAEAEKQYKDYMSANDTPLQWPIVAPYDIDQIEKVFEHKLTNFPLEFFGGHDADKDPAEVEWAIDIAREIKYEAESR